MSLSRQSGASLAARVVIAVVLLGVAVWAILNSVVFSMRDVRVMGARSIPRAEILRIAAVDEGENLITLPTAEVSARLEEHPRIAEADVGRDLPATLLIHVRERRPAGWVEDPSGAVIVAGDGTILARAQRQPTTLPAVGAWPDELAPGDTVDTFSEPLRISSAMPPWLRKRIASADLDDGDVVLELRGQGIVLFGTPTDVASKNQALGSMLRWAEEEGIAVRALDVRVPSAPSLSPARGATITPPLPTS